ncbi:hypothetical protein JCGZ_13578 [Jatropha curcas]|uniref:Uncharacterized protein n=1 Tax=Jatropha curcas TaxID=180498 RepID=A0A067KA69_JATCU|nr:hypothetical protein JCGZ_13578 [Jatropha curcas]
MTLPDCSSMPDPISLVPLSASQTITEPKGGPNDSGHEKDAFISTGPVARAIAAQCALPANMECLEAIEEEPFLDQIDSGPLMDRATHLNSSLKLSARVEQLVKKEDEQVVIIHQLCSNLARAEANVDEATRSLNDILLHQADLIITKLWARFPDEDWCFVSWSDTYQDLDEVEETVAGSIALAENA